MRPDRRFERQEFMRAAVQAAAERCGGRPELYARLGVSSSWVYACVRNGTMPLRMAISVHLLTGGEYRWFELAADELGELLGKIKKSATEDDLRLAIMSLRNS